MRREESLDRLNENFDIVIIGGGATGLGTAVDAATRGFKVALLEARDFAQGTSSRSTKLVHGGVRYLAQGRMGLVREALLERGRLRRNASHLVVDLPFVVPAYDWWSGPYIGVGLKLYDVLAGKQRMGKSRGMSRDEVLERIPTARQEGLRGGLLYFDGQFDDARLAMTLALTAADAGAVLVNHAPVIALQQKDGKTVAATVRDDETGREYTVAGKIFINATGVFADDIRRMETPGLANTVLPSQGAHLVLPSKFLPGGNAMIIPKSEDGRVVFLIPWKGRTVVGTTDHPVTTTEVDPVPQDEEVEMLLEHAQQYLALPVSRSDILSSFAGLRPLVRPKGSTDQTRSVSRDHEIFVSPQGLLTVVGGKWTTYRKMAEDTVDRAIKLVGLDQKPCVTQELRLHAAPETEVTVDPLDPFAVYGSDAGAVRVLGHEHPELALRLHPRLPVVGAQVVWAARHEMARTVEDVLSRRTRALLLDADAAENAAPTVAAILQKELGRDDAWAQQQLESFRRLSRAALAPSAAPRAAV